MLDPTDVSYQAEHKALEFPTSFEEDPLSDLFNQCISHDPSSSSDNANQPSGLELFDFTFDDDTTSSGSNGGHYSLANSKLNGLQRLTQANVRHTQSQEILPSQIYQKFARFERPSAAISGAELLNLEGKSSLPVRPALSSFAATPNPPLRRKARFSANPPETLRSRNHKVSKSAGLNGVEGTKMMRPYYYQNEIPSSQEWTERFEQISLQPPQARLPKSPPLSESFLRNDKRPRNVPSAPPSQINLRRETSEQSGNRFQGETLPEITEFNTLSPQGAISHAQVPLPKHQNMTFSACREAKTREMTGPALRSPPPPLSPSWLQPTVSTESFDFTISPHQMHTNWTPNLADPPGSCYANAQASQSAPVLPHSSADLSGLGIMVDYDPFGEFLGDDPSTKYPIAPSDLFHTPNFDVHPHPLPSPTAAFHRPQTPSTRSSSPCLSPPPASKSPSKHRRRSKSTRRKSSAGALKSPNTLGFVNFTPGDSQKILSGVAPSGSSKTKARREQEAIEKKRRLSLAAEKVIKEAGGDVEKLRAAGLFV